MVEDQEPQRPAAEANIERSARSLDGVLLRPGDSISFANRDDLLESLDRLDQPIATRKEGRSPEHREHFCTVRYLEYLAGEDLLPLPATLRKPPKGQDPPDFILEWSDGKKETFELTEGSTPEYQKLLTEASKIGRPWSLPVDVNLSSKEAAERWAQILFSAFLRKSEALRRGHYDLDHLLIYDLTGLGLLVPLDQGRGSLKRLIQEWWASETPRHRFGRISVLRDLALLFDVMGEGRVLRRTSPYFQIATIRAHDEEDLKRRLRELDRYSRQNSIRHLKTFGSVRKGDRIALREDSDLDLLVEFEPGTRVTFLDMARMERELGELIGFKVDLRTEGDLSRYFRQEVLNEAVELRA